jgi:hypothetical protein
MNKEKRPEALRRAADRTAVLRAAGADPMLRDTKGHSVFDQLAAFAKFAQLSDSDYALLRQSLQ